MLIKCLKVEPMKLPKVIEIEDTLEDLQREVGGYIEALLPFDNQEIGIICNEEGKLLGLQPNRGIYLGNGRLDVVCGNFLIIGIGEEDFRSLTEAELNYYSILFYHIEVW